MLIQRMWFVLFLSVLAVGCSNSVPVTPTTPTPAPVSENKVDPLLDDAPQLALEEGFDLLSFDAFERFSAKDPGKTVVWEAAGNGFNCNGKPRGYLYSKQSYDNFTLKFDYRFRRPADLKNDADFKGNTGALLYITGDHKQWPISLEVQGKYVEMASIKANGGAKDVVINDDASARQTARKPVGDWNQISIMSKDGVLTASINGTQVCSNEAGELKSGLIGFQAEDFEVQFRNVRIRNE
jgi:hypothetical protein